MTTTAKSTRRDGAAPAAERDALDATIRSLAAGLSWAQVTVTTVGYGDTYHRSDVGRGVGVALMLVGVGLIGVITANLAALFVGAREDIFPAGVGIAVRTSNASRSSWRVGAIIRGAERAGGADGQSGAAAVASPRDWGRWSVGAPVGLAGDLMAIMVDGQT